MKQVAVLGANGRLGRSLCATLGTQAIALPRSRLDITDRDLVVSQLIALKPDLIINAAAFTNVDQAETDIEQCRDVNVRGVSNIVEACRVINCPLVHVSTDYVFGSDWNRTTPYRETDATGPLNVYGQTKLDGERLALQWPKCFLLRTCGLYGGWGEVQDFASAMLQRAGLRESLRVVGDQHCTPTYVPHLTRAILALVETSEFGLYHVTNSGSTTWHEFASKIVRLADSRVTLNSISSQEYGAIARRPTYSVLDTSKYHSLNGPLMPSWQEGLDAWWHARRRSF